MHHLSKPNHYIWRCFRCTYCNSHQYLLLFQRICFTHWSQKEKKRNTCSLLFPSYFGVLQIFLVSMVQLTWPNWTLVEHLVAGSLELTSPSEQGSSCRSSRWLYYTCQWHSSRLLVNVGFTRDVKLLIVELCLLSCIASMGAHMSPDCIPQQQSLYKRPLWSELAESGIVKRFILDISVGIVPNLVQSTYSNSWLC